MPSGVHEPHGRGREFQCTDVILRDIAVGPFVGELMPASKVVLRRLPRSRLPPLRCDVRLFIVSRYLARAETCVVYERHLKWPDDGVVAPAEACWRAGKTISQAAWPLLDHSGPVKHFAWIFLYRDRPCQEHP